MKQMGMLVVSLRCVNFFGYFGPAKVAREKRQYFKPWIESSFRIVHEEIVFLLLYGVTQSLGHAFRGSTESFKSISQTMRMGSL